MTIDFGPKWWHDYGILVFSKRFCLRNGIWIFAGNFASLEIRSVNNGRLWEVEWQSLCLENRKSTGTVTFTKSTNTVICTGNELSVALGLSRLYGVNRGNDTKVTSISILPGTDHNGFSNISIKLSDNAKKIMVQLLLGFEST
jgi:hypothetical protein